MRLASTAGVMEKEQSKLSAEIGIDPLCCPAGGQGRLVRVRTFDREEAGAVLAALFIANPRVA